MNSNVTKSVACSGATTSSVVSADENYWGQGDRLISLIPNKSLAEKENLQSVAKDSFLPGRIHQETFVKDYQPKVITVGIGGNDVGFADKLQACLGPDTCSWAGTIEGREKTAVEMKGLFNKLVTTYQNLQNDSPDSKIYAIGYPRFIEPSGECSALRELLLDSVERRFIDEGVIYLNQIIKAAAKKVGIKYISIADSYGNHKMCGSSPEEAANFIKAGDDIGLPGDWLSWVKLVGQESFHPNALGHQLAAGAILAATNGNIETYDYCSGQVSCPQNVSAPEPSSYWLPGAYHNYLEQKLVDFVGNVAWIEMRYAKMSLRLAKYALMPYSIIDVEINSTPRSLGQYTVADDGSFNTEIDLPEDLEEGYHTVHIYGKSYSGENVDLYQVIGYFKPEVPTNEESVAQLPIAKNDTKNQIVSISNNNIQTDDVVRVDDGDSMKDSFGVWSGGMFIDNNITSAGHIDQSILSAATTKKEIITERSLSEQADDTMRNVIVATVCALFAAILTAVVVRFNRP